MILPFTSDEARRAAREVRPAVAGIAVTSFVIALFPVAVALYLLLLFDVAIPGRSVGTLIGISLLMLGLVGIHAVLRLLRRRMLGHVQDIVVVQMLSRLDEAAAQVASASDHAHGDGDQAGRDMDAIRQFLKGPAAAAWLDIAAFPVLLLTMLILHGWLAVSLILFAIILTALLFRTVQLLEQPTRDVVPLLARRHTVATLGRSHRDIITGLGMRQHARRVWMLINASLSRVLDNAGRHHLLMLTIVRTVLFAAFGTALTIGGALAINDRASSGVVFAAAMLTWLALEPLVRANAGAASLVAARQGWTRIDTLLHSVPAETATIELPAPSRKIDCETIVVVHPGARKPTIQGVSFSLQAGDVLAVVGSAGSGKSTLIRAIGGAIPVTRGKIRLDDAALDQWGEDRLAAHVGFLPQSIQLIDGSVAENIARFDPDADPQTVVAAAQAAGAHEMIVRLPEGYNTVVGHNGARLALSQAQRIGFARALYGSPFLLALDEPTAFVDLHGEQAFIASIEGARERGAIVVLAGNANSLVQVATHVLVLRDGMAVEFGAKEEVRQRMAERRKRMRVPAQDKTEEQGNEATQPDTETETSS